MTALGALPLCVVTTLTDDVDENHVGQSLADAASALEAGAVVALLPTDPAATAISDQVAAHGKLNLPGRTRTYVVALGVPINASDEARISSIEAMDVSVKRTLSAAYGTSVMVSNLLAAPDELVWQAYNEAVAVFRTIR